jgi:hypothetical protein
MSQAIERRADRLRRIRALVILLLLVAVTLAAVWLAAEATPPTGRVVTVTT